MIDDFKDFQAYGTVTFVKPPTYEVEQSALVYYYVENLMQKVNLFILKDFKSLFTETDDYQWKTLDHQKL